MENGKTQTRERQTTLDTFCIREFGVTSDVISHALKLRENRKNQLHTSYIKRKNKRGSNEVTVYMNDQGLKTYSNK